MQTEKVYSIDNISVWIVSSGGNRSLRITVEGENTNSNYTNIRLEPINQTNPPANGIYEFNMVGDVPPIVDHLMTKVRANYTFPTIPPVFNGVKVYGATNYKEVRIHINSAEKAAAISGAELKILKAEAVVDEQLMGPSKGDKLNVHVDYDCSFHGSQELKPMIPQGTNPGILMLEFHNLQDEIYLSNPRHINYTQYVKGAEQYHSIELFYQGKKVGVIDKIAIVV